MRVNNLAYPLPFVESRLIEIGRRKLLIVRFRPLRRKFRGSFGIHLKRLQDAIYLARSVDASLYIGWYSSAPNQAVNQLSSLDVRIVRPSLARNALVSALWLATSPLAALKRLLHPTLKSLSQVQWEREKAHRLRTKRIPAGGVEGSVRAKPAFLLVVGLLLRWTEPVQSGRKLSLRREMAGDPIRVRLPSSLEEAARAQAERLELDREARIVTLHIREPGWRRIEDDSRSCDIDTFRPAIDELVGRGFHVVRIGDASMTPIGWPGVFDLATHPARTDLLELWCMLHSVYYLGSESGPLELAKLIGVPMLLVNIKSVQSGFPLHRTDLFILKRLLSPDEPYVLSLREQLAVKARKLEFKGSPRYFDNSAEDILAALLELLQQNGHSPESPAQAEFHRLASTKIIEGREHAKFLGEGRLAEFFADRYLDQREVLPASSEPGAGGLPP